MDWINAHWGILSAAAVAILDLAFALSPKLEASGILHQLYLLIKPAPKA